MKRGLREEGGGLCDLHLTSTYGMLHQMMCCYCSFEACWHVIYAMMFLVVPSLSTFSLLESLVVLAALFELRWIFS